MCGSVGIMILWFGPRTRVEKLRYIHRNPVKRGLVLEPDQWAWRLSVVCSRRARAGAGQSTAAGGVESTIPAKLLDRC